MITSSIYGGPLPPLSFRRVFDLLDLLSDRQIFFRKHGRSWRLVTNESFIRQVNALSLGLIRAGIGKGDRVAIVSANRTEWSIVDFAIQQLGAVSVPLYPTSTPEEFAYILNQAGVKMAFTGNADLYKKVRSSAAHISSLQGIYCLDKLPGIPHWSQLKYAALGMQHTILEAHKAAVGPDDLLTIIYTSGTTGEPKGVMLTHRNMVASVEAVRSLLPIEAGDRALSFLPMCHVFERSVLYLYLRAGLKIHYLKNMDHIAEHIAHIKPHGFTTVPRLIEKLYEHMVMEGKQLNPLARWVYFQALKLGHRYDPSRPMGPWYNARLALARRLIFSKWQQALGGDIKMIVSGSAALSPALVRVFRAAGLPVLQGYGLTETSLGTCVSRFEEAEFEATCVGRPIPGVEVKIADDGEILIRGPHIMKGYFNKPDKTAEAIDADGWFHTGDVGEIVKGKFLKITDRKKEIFKTSGGKYVAPQLIENRLKASPLIDQVMVIGDGRKFPSALIVPDYQALRAYLKEKGIEVNDNREAIAHPEAIDKISQEVEKTNAGLAQYERIKQPRLLAEAFSIEASELTPTHKLRRKVIEKHYHLLIEGIYQ